MADPEVEIEILSNQGTSPPDYSSGAVAAKYAPWANTPMIPGPTRFLQPLGWVAQQVQLTAQPLPLYAGDADAFTKVCEALDSKGIPLADRRTVAGGKAHPPWETGAQCPPRAVQARARDLSGRP